MVASADQAVHGACVCPLARSRASRGVKVNPWFRSEPNGSHMDIPSVLLTLARKKRPRAEGGQRQWKTLQGVAATCLCAQNCAHEPSPNDLRPLRLHHHRSWV